MADSEMVHLRGGRSSASITGAGRDIYRALRGKALGVSIAGERARRGSIRLKV